MAARRKRWTPTVTLSRRILRLLLVAHREGIIELSADEERQVRDWAFFRFLTLPVRWRLGDLWKKHGPEVVEAGVQEASEELQSALCA